MDPVELQVLTGALHSICEEMGAVLIRSAPSANIKERRDCSTALFDPGGEMVMQAEHIPVHLGAMPAAVAAVVVGEPRAGVSWAPHHAGVGGKSPGSVPADSTTLDEEGVVIAPRVLDDAAVAQLSSLM